MYILKKFMLKRVENMGILTDKNKKKEKTEAENVSVSFRELLKSRRVKILSGVFIVLLLLALISTICIWLPLRMFSKNPRFTLAKVKISAHPKGYWKDKENKICGIMKIKVGSDNLFAFNLKNLSSKLLASPSIESVSISRVLPDTLLVKIMEREPRALINSPHSPYVVDVNGNLMLRTECMDITSSLPVISGIRNLALLKNGEKVLSLSGAMEMLHVIKTKWPDIRVDRIVVKEKNRSLLCAVRYKSFPEPFVVEMPEKNIPLKVQELATALDRIVNTASTKRKINLMYENRAVLTDLPGRSSSSRMKKYR